jgi:hypothetical protein
MDLTLSCREVDCALRLLITGRYHSSSFDQERVKLRRLSVVLRLLGVFRKWHGIEVGGQFLGCSQHLKLLFRVLNKLTHAQQELVLSGLLYQRPEIGVVYDIELGCAKCR